MFGKRKRQTSIRGVLKTLSSIYKMIFFEKEALKYASVYVKISKICACSINRHVVVHLSFLSTGINGYRNGTLD